MVQIKKTQIKIQTPRTSFVKNKGTTYLSINDSGIKRKYRYYPKIPINTYLEYHRYHSKGENIFDYSKRQLLKPKQRTQLHKIKAETFRKPVQITDAFTKGKTSTVKVPNVLKMQPQQLRAYVKQLIRPLVKDKELTDILSEEQNVNKYRHRLQLQYQIRGNPGKGRAQIDYTNIEQLATATAIGNKTPVKGTIEIQQLNNEKITYIGGENTSNNIRNLKNQGFNWQHKQNGSVTEADLIITFR